VNSPGIDLKALRASMTGKDACPTILLLTSMPTRHLKIHPHDLQMTCIPEFQIAG
jgi:hypothetical protein